MGISKRYLTGKASRWLAFSIMLVSLAVLTSGIPTIQWLGWLISCISTLWWAYFAYTDKDIPRTLMEVCYFWAALIGIHNWF